MKQTSEEIMNNWKKAYREATRKEPVIEFFNGWYRVSNSKDRVRGSEIVEMTGHLAEKVRRNDSNRSPRPPGSSS